MKTPKKPEPTFAIVVKGPGLAPERLPVRLLSDILGAVQKLATGAAKVPVQASLGDSADTPHGIGLISVTRGSAHLNCVAFEPSIAVERIGAIGSVLNGQSDDLPEGDGYADLKAIRTLSAAAKQLEGTIAVVIPGKASTPLFQAGEDSHEKLASRLTVSSESSVFAKVVRVGGATRMRCSLRVRGMQGLLYCTVKDQKLSRQLGDRLFQDVVAYGRARWLTKTWRLIGFDVRSIMIPGQRSLSEAGAAIVKANDSAWAKVDDPREILGE